MRTEEASHRDSVLLARLAPAEGAGISPAGLAQSLVERRGWIPAFLLSPAAQGALGKAFPGAVHVFPCSWPRLLATSWN